MGFCQGGRKKSCLLTRVSAQRASTVYTVETPVSGHPREGEKVSATAAGRLRECVNTDTV